MPKPRSIFATLIALVAAAALIAVPAADAGPSKANAFTLGFDGVYKQGKPVKVKNFVFSNLPVTCAEGSTTYSTPSKLPAMKVNSKLKFKGKFVKSGIKTKVTGKYKRNLSKIRGTLRVSGSFGAFTGCKSGKVRWSAV